MTAHTTGSEIWQLPSCCHFSLIRFITALSGSCCLVTVHQPPVITAALGHDVIMPCQLNLSPDETLLTVPVLYWTLISQDAEEHRLWEPSEVYEGRVQLLDENLNSLNKSILLRNVQWADNGKYECKLSVITETKRFRSKGNETLLTVYGNLFLLLQWGGWRVQLKTELG